jgi:hypothetical protein
MEKIFDVYEDLENLQDDHVHLASREALRKITKEMNQFYKIDYPISES